MGLLTEQLVAGGPTEAIQSLHFCGDRSCYQVVSGRSPPSFFQSHLSPCPTHNSGHWMAWLGETADSLSSFLCTEHHQSALFVLIRTSRRSCADSPFWHSLVGCAGLWRALEARGPIHAIGEKVSLPFIFKLAVYIVF